MSFFKAVQTEQFWRDFFNFTAEKILPERKVLNKVKKIIEEEKYLDFNEDYFNTFKNKATPHYVKIPQYNTKKTRNVFIYKFEYNIIFKAMSYYMLLNYNDKFSSNSLAYTWGKGPKTAFDKLKSFNLTKKDIVYKNDFSDYFNAIKLERLEPRLKDFFNKDELLIDFIVAVLKNPNVVHRNKRIQIHDKGVMAGTPISGILANVYMHEVDLAMKQNNFKYIRYADDTLIVGQKALDYFKDKLKDLEINFNPKKEEIFNIETDITFLGFKFTNNVIDLSDEAKAKMKSRMKRRARWYQKWARVKNVPIETAIKDYIAGINEKLYTDLEDSMNWSRWYMPSITTVETIQWLDDYFVNCIRYLDSGTWSHNSKYYRLKYKDIKKLGYTSLVNTYYRVKKGQPIPYNPPKKYKRERKSIDFPL